MNSLKQYIDLYLQHSDLVDKGSAEPLNRLRPEACKRLQGMTLPRKGEENYENIDLDKILATDYGLNLARVPLDINPTATFHCGVPNMSTNLFMLLDDMYAESHVAQMHLPAGVIAGSLRKIAKDNPELVEKYLGTCAPDSDALVNLNTMLAQDGFMLYVPKNTVVERPLQLVNILQNGVPMMAVRRILVVIEDGAEAKLLICDHTQNDNVEMLSLQTMEVIVGKGAKLEIYDLEESSELTRRLSGIYLRQERDSNVVVAGFTLYNGITRNEYHCDFKGEGASLRLLGMAIEDCNRLIDTNSVVRHNCGGCHTDELFKYVLDDASTGAFNGLIYVAEGAEKTEAYQANRNIVGSEEARMYSKPQLEIYNDDVKCSHGSATGSLDPMQLFYMRSRGIPEAEARLLLKQAFMADVLDAIRMDTLRERLRSLVERRFAGESHSCASCAQTSNCHGHQ